MKHPRAIDAALVDAYLARRALDYLVGFTLSPVLWRKLPGRTVGRSRAVGGAAARLRPRARDREIRRRANTGRSSPTSRRRTARRSPPGSSAPTASGSTGSMSALATEAAAFKSALQKRRVHGPLGRGEARQAPPVSALHHLDAAAGGIAQARLRAGAHDADRPAPLRGRRHRRRDRRPHYLYAHRRRRHGARGDRRRPQRHRQGIRRQISAGRAAQIHRQGQERPGSA